MKPSVNTICDVVRQVAVKGNVRGLDEQLVKFCEDDDYIVRMSTGKWGTRPAGRQLLGQRVEQDQRAMLALIK